MIDVLALLNKLEIPYERFDHEPVYTCEQANSLGLDIDGVQTKNLFLRDRKGKRHFLLVVSDHKQIDLADLSEKLQVKQLSFASAERLKTYLATEPGSVSILGAVQDLEGKVEVIVDQDVWLSDRLQCHPLVNTCTLVIRLAGIQKLFGHLGRSVTIMAL